MSTSLGDVWRATTASRTATVLAVIAAVALVAGAGLAGTATAGDNVAFVDFEPDELDVEPGDEVEIDVVIETDGAHGGVGVEEIALRVDYPTEYVTVTEIEGGDWFLELADEDQDLDPSEEVVYDDDHGAVMLTQSVNDRSGVVGEAAFATITVEVHEDADPAIAELSAAGVDDGPTDVYVTSGWFLPLSPAPAELVIDGGGETVSPAFDPDAFADDAETETESSDGDGADSDEADDEENANGDTAGSTPDDAASGDASDDDAPAPVGASIVGVLTALWLFRRR